MKRKYEARSRRKKRLTRAKVKSAEVFSLDKFFRKYFFFLICLVVFIFIKLIMVSTSVTSMVVINEFRFSENVLYHELRHNITTESTKNTSFCEPENLVGQLRIQFDDMFLIEGLNRSSIKIPDFVAEKMVNGLHKPTCRQRPGRSVAIIVPFRDKTGVRTYQLYSMLHFMIPILTRQNIKFGFFVINQVGDAPFNRAKLLNIGFQERV